VCTPRGNGDRTCCTLWRNVAAWAADALTNSLPAEQRDAGPGCLDRWSWSGQGALAFAHGVTLQGNLVRVVDEPVKDGIG
jgi:hypothetical protein